MRNAHVCSGTLTRAAGGGVSNGRKIEDWAGLGQAGAETKTNGEMTGKMRCDRRRKRETRGYNEM